MSSYYLLPSVEPQIRDLLERHKQASAKNDWSYHEYLPLEALRANPSQTQPLSELSYASIETALLTEAILPYYTAALSESFKNSSEAMQEFAQIWTGEEDQHSLLLETYLLITDSGDHGKRNRLRQSVLKGGWTHDLTNQFEVIAYTSVQEMATRTFYLHAARACESDDPTLARALRQISKDETLHMTFYRDVVKLHLEADPDYLPSLARVIMQFRMPGDIVPDSKERSLYLADRDVLSPAQFYRDVIENLWSYWSLDRLTTQAAATDGPVAQLIKLRRVMGIKASRRLRNRSVSMDSASTSVESPV